MLACSYFLGHATCHWRPTTKVRFNSLGLEISRHFYFFNEMISISRQIKVLPFVYFFGTAMAVGSWVSCLSSAKLPHTYCTDHYLLSSRLWGFCFSALLDCALSFWLGLQGAGLKAGKYKIMKIMICWALRCIGDQCATYFTYIIVCNLFINSTGQILLHLFYSWEKNTSERLNNLPSLSASRWQAWVSKPCTQIRFVLHCDPTLKTWMDAVI
jgi:hypothetical protein